MKKGKEERKGGREEDRERERERDKGRKKRWKAGSFLSYLLNSTLTASSRPDPALCCK